MTSDTTYLTIAKGTYRAAMNLVDDMILSYINKGSKYYIVAKAQSLYQEYIELLVYAEEDISKAECYEEFTIRFSETKIVCSLSELKKR